MSAASTNERRLSWLEHYRRYGRRGISQRARRTFRKLAPREQLRRSIRRFEAFDKWGLPEPEPHWLSVLQPNAPGYRFMLGGRRVSPGEARVGAVSRASAGTVPVLLRQAPSAPSTSKVSPGMTTDNDRQPAAGGNKIFTYHRFRPLKTLLT